MADTGGNPSSPFSPFLSPWARRFLSPLPLSPLVAGAAIPSFDIDHIIEEALADRSFVEAATGAVSPSFDNNHIEEALSDPAFVEAVKSAEDTHQRKKKALPKYALDPNLPKVRQELIVDCFFVATSHLFVLNSQQYHFDRFTYTAKNFNKQAYQLDCKYKRSCACPGKWSFPIDSTTDYPDLRRGRALNAHSDKCVIKSGLDSFALDGHLKDKPADGRDDRKSPPELPTDISQEMKAKTEELAVLHLTHPPEKICGLKLLTSLEIDKLPSHNVKNKCIPMPCIGPHCLAQNWMIPVAGESRTG